MAGRNFTASTWRAVAVAASIVSISLVSGPAQALSVYTTAFTNPVTVNLKVSWGSVGSYALPSNALGASSSALYGYFTYAQVVSMLTQAATGAVDAAAVKALPAAAAAGTTKYALTFAQAKALGQRPAAHGAYDGYIGFGGPTSNYTFSQASTIATGTYDFIGVAEHEISEVLGRQSGIGYGYRTVMDLFRYSAPGVLSYTATQAAYFSLDGGKTALTSFNNLSGGDRGDWLSSASKPDAYSAFAWPGQIEALNLTDLKLIDTLGWKPNPNATIALNLGGQTATFIGYTGAPEPAGLSVLGVGLAALGVVARRRR